MIQDTLRYKDISSIWGRTKPHLWRSDEEQQEVIPCACLTRSDVTGSHVTFPLLFFPQFFPVLFFPQFLFSYFISRTFFPLPFFPVFFPLSFFSSISFPVPFFPQFVFPYFFPPTFSNYFFPRTFSHYFFPYFFELFFSRIFYPVLFFSHFSNYFVSRTFFLVLFSRTFSNVATFEIQRFKISVSCFSRTCRYNTVHVPCGISIQTSTIGLPWKGGVRGCAI